MKYHEVVFRFGAAAGTRPQITLNIQKTLKGVRAITLKEYHFIGVPAANNQTFRLNFPGTQIRPQQTSNSNRGGYLVSASTDARGAGTSTAAHTLYDTPKLVAQCTLPSLERLTLEVDGSEGGAVTWQEATFWFYIYYEDEHTDLGVVATEQGIREPIRGQNNWRHPYIPTQAQQGEMYDAITQAVFSSPTTQ